MLNNFSNYVFLQGAGLDGDVDIAQLTAFIQSGAELLDTFNSGQTSGNQIAVARYTKPSAPATLAASGAPIDAYVLIATMFILPSLWLLRRRAFASYRR